MSEECGVSKTRLFIHTLEKLTLFINLDTLLNILGEVWKKNYTLTKYHKKLGLILAVVI